MAAQSSPGPVSELAAMPTARCPQARGAGFPGAGNAWVLADRGFPRTPVAGSAMTPPGLGPRWCLWGPRQEVTLSISCHTRLPKGAGRGLPLPLWDTE